VRGAVRFEDSPNARNRGYGFRVVAASP
jgi:hypothetical protein